jgi:putative ABC transport system permease protein
MMYSGASFALVPSGGEVRRKGARPWVGARASLWVFALRNLGSRPTRSALALLGLSIPVLGVIGLFSLSAGIRNLLGETLAQVQGILVVRENAPSDLFSDLPVGMVDRLREVPGVRAVAPQIWKIAPPIEGRSLLPRAAARLLGQAQAEPLSALLNVIQIEGQDLTDSARLKGEVYRSRMLPAQQGGGRFLDLSDQGRANILISTTIAREFPDLRGHPRVVGDRLKIGARSFTIVGMYDTGSMLLDHTIVMDLATARHLLSLGDETVSCFLVEPNDPAGTEETARTIERAISGVDARTMAQFQAGIGRILGNLDRLLFLILSLALLVGSVGVLNTMLMSTTQRLFEFGIMRTSGWSRGDVLRLVLAESLSLGLLAGLLGCLLALAGAMLINPFLGGGMRLVVTPGLLLLGLGLALGLGALGGLYPAWRASRMAPMETIRMGSR